jgi:3-methyladenine DNA glycosylase AlkD
MHQSAAAIIKELKSYASPEKAQHLQRFFKTSIGQYAEGDIFWGLTVPTVRNIARTNKKLDVQPLEKLLEHEVHEVRLCGVLILVFQAQMEPEKTYNLYLSNTKFINNWDLVDLSAWQIVGTYLLDKDCEILYQLARSNLVWERRIAVVSTYAFIKSGRHEHTLNLAKALMTDKHDLMHKAVGWMLREVGKRCSMDVLKSFLEKFAATMPRTALRYAIEHMSDEDRKYFMQAKKKS